jgi:uncharacterized protein (TIGR02611 family)
VAGERTSGGRKRTIDRIRERKDRHRQRSRLYRASFAASGFVVIAVGIVLIPLPGPGWLIVAIGLAMLALEFDSAERLLELVLDRLERVAEQAVAASPVQKLLGTLAVLAGGAALIGAALLWGLPFVPV